MPSNIKISDSKVYPGIYSQRCAKIIIDKTVVSYSIYYINFSDKEITILDLYTNEAMRNIGYASYILNYIVKKANSLGFKSVQLDNMSENKTSIYEKAGFIYREIGYPEMIYKIE